MRADFKQIILKSTGAQTLEIVDIIQELWSGYGSIVRYKLTGCNTESIVVKHVKLPQGGNHPRGWNTANSHNRKIRSYEVECYYYKHWNQRTNNECRTPHCLALETIGDETIMVLEDLDSSGFPLRKTSISFEDINCGLIWLANFHATFLQESPEGLWDIGSYWHLDTRPDELKELKGEELYNYASKIDEALNSCTYKTFVHGDAKLANFCFSPNQKIAAVDFQYIGGGCGMKDVAYFIGSCLYEEDCEKYEQNILNTYFGALKQALQTNNSEVIFEELEKEWRMMYHYAWADFHRFLKGWSPGHWKINSYSERITREVIAKIKRS